MATDAGAGARIASGRGFSVGSANGLGIGLTWYRLAGIEMWEGIVFSEECAKAASSNGACTCPCALTFRATPMNATPAINETERHNTPSDKSVPRTPLAEFPTPNNLATRAAKGRLFAAMINLGEVRDSAIRASACAYANGLPHTTTAISSQQFSRSSRIRLFNHQT